MFYCYKNKCKKEIIASQQNNSRFNLTTLYLTRRQRSEN